MKEEEIKDLALKFQSGLLECSYQAYQELKQENKQLQNQVEKLTGENNDLEEKYIRERDKSIKLTLKLSDLEEENEHLKAKINVYENPDDLTLMFMYCDVIAKDKIKELQSVIDKAIEFIEENKIFYSGLQNEDLEIGLFENEIKDLLEILRSKEWMIMN